MQSFVIKIFSQEIDGVTINNGIRWDMAIGFIRHERTMGKDWKR